MRPFDVGGGLAQEAEVWARAFFGLSFQVPMTPRIARPFQVLGPKGAATY